MMARVTAVLVLAVATITLLAGSAPPQAPAITPIDCAGADSTVVGGINDAGRVVGFSFAGETPSAFITDGHHGCQALPGLEPGYMPINLNASEHVVGIHVGTDGEQRGFLYRSGQVTDFWYPAATTCQTMPFGINSRGQIVGFYDLTENDCGLDLPFMWEDGAYAPLGGIQDALPATHNSVSATGINPRGDIIGEWLDNPNQIDYGYLLPRDGQIVSFGFPIAGNPGGVAKVTMPTAINPQGEIVGFFYTALDPDDPALEGAFFGPCRGFFRDRDGTMTELKVPGATYTCTMGLNAAGDISGIWTDDPRTSDFAGIRWHGFIAKRDALIGG